MPAPPASQTVDPVCTGLVAQAVSPAIWNPPAGDLLHLVRNRDVDRLRWETRAIAAGLILQLSGSGSRTRSGVRADLKARRQIEVADINRDRLFRELELLQRRLRVFDRAAFQRAG